MSCIVGISRGKSAEMWADSRLSNSTNIVPSHIVKVYQPKVLAPHIIFGFTGSLKTIQNIIHIFNTLIFVEGNEQHSKILSLENNTYDECIVFSRVLEENLRDAGEIKWDTDTESKYMDCEMMVLGAEHINIIAENFAVLPIKNKYHAIGDGSNYVLGAIESDRIQFSDDTDKFIPEDKTVIAALTACARYCGTVAPPFERYVVCSNERV